MKRIEKEIKSYKTIYVAFDGTEFDNEKECATYEKSASGIITARYAKLVIRKADEGLLLNGDEDHEIDFVKPTCERDKDTIMQMFFHFVGQDYENLTRRFEEYIERAIKEDDILFVRWNYDHDWCYALGTRNSIKENIDKCVQDFTKDDVEQK